MVDNTFKYYSDLPNNQTANLISFSDKSYLLIYLNYKKCCLHIHTYFKCAQCRPNETKTSYRASDQTWDLSTLTSQGLPPTLYATHRNIFVCCTIYSLIQFTATAAALFSPASWASSVEARSFCGEKKCRPRVYQPGITARFVNRGSHPTWIIKVRSLVGWGMPLMSFDHKW